MSTTIDNPNLGPDGKLIHPRGKRRRLGLQDPQARMQELWQESQDRANETAATPPSSKVDKPKQTGLPLDAADRSDESLMEAISAKKDSS